MFAIRNKKTGKFVYGTDYRHKPPHQRTSDNEMLTYSELLYASIDAKCRGCGKEYEVVELEPVKIKKVYSQEEAKRTAYEFSRGTV